MTRISESANQRIGESVDQRIGERADRNPWADRNLFADILHPPVNCDRAWE